MAEERIDALPIPAAEQEAVAAIVRAIRRVYDSPDGIGGVEKFTVHNVHDFARALLEQGVSVREPQ